ncbi:MAG: sulfotransferase domain-containing protein [Leptolyngbyaceae cyanobacterium RM1_406_9]|nr:sulfotransferase domain-containing protein [Leptolyngbyaceae cyanobacterium RM1_406_9]
MKHSSPLLGYFGHHKGATVWIRSIIKQVCKIVGLNHVAVSNVGAFNQDLAAFVDQNDIDFISYTNAKFEYVQPLEPFKGFHVIRDPRDIVVSAYFSHLRTHPIKGWSELVEFRDRLHSVSKNEGLILEMDFRRKSFDDMYNWNYSSKYIKELKMEDLIQNPRKEFVDIFKYLELLKNSSFLELAVQRGLESFAMFRRRQFKHSPKASTPDDISEQQLQKIVKANDFSVKSGGRKPGEEDLNSHFRKGIAGDWKNHFNQQHIDYFKEQYGDLLIKLGYEQDKNW